MSNLNFFKRFHSGGWRQKNHFSQCFCSEDEFFAILKRERERSDRSGEKFALVIFTPPFMDFKNTNSRMFLRSIIRRLRSIDEVGWVDGHHIGVILPGSAYKGASVFANTIQTLNAETLPNLNYSIFVYPINSNKAEGDPQTHDRDTSNMGEERQLEDILLALTDAPKIIKKNRLSLQKKDSCAPPIGCLFVKKMPLWKRAMDITGSIFGLIFLSPLILGLSILIKLTSPGPVFYKQERTGYGGSSFTLYKFRTMKSNANSENHQKYLSELIQNSISNQFTQKPMNKLEADPQIIPFGQILRKTCMDELPQLLNVLLGDMSLVGPRPPIPYEVKEYINWHKERFDIVPGMTGLWQVSGKNDLTFRQMVSLDIQYIKNLSFLFDLKILIKTPYAIIKQIIAKSMASQIEKTGVEQNA